MFYNKNLLHSKILAFKNQIYQIPTHYIFHSRYLIIITVVILCQITEKDELTAATDLFSLQAFSIRKGTKLENGYLIGRYGAVPFIKGGL